MKYRVREVQSFLRIKELNDRIFPGEPLEKHEMGYYWVAYKDQASVGYCGMHVCKGSRELDAVFLSRAGVLPAHRGKGLGKKLISVRIRLARKIGMKCVITYTRPWNLSSANNLIHAGFTLYEPAYKFGYEKDLYWRLDL